MSEQLERGDRKVVKVGENSYRVYAYDGATWQKYRHHFADQEAVTNYLYDDRFTPIGTDEHGNLIIRPKD